MSVKKLAVPDANPGNLLVTHSTEMGCCGPNLETCKYVAAVDPGDTVTNVTAIVLTVNGVNTTITFPAAANTAKEVRMAIAAALKGAGYDPYYSDSYKGVQVGISGTEIQIIGEAIPVSATIDGAVTAFEKRCTMASVCESSFTVLLDTEVGALGVNGTEGDDIGTGGFATGEGTDLQAAIIDALDGASVNYTAVEVEEVDGTFVFIIHAPAGIALTVDGVDAVINRCYPDFIA